MRAADVRKAAALLAASADIAEMIKADGDAKTRRYSIAGITVRFATADGEGLEYEPATLPRHLYTDMLAWLRQTVDAMGVAEFQE